MQMDGSLVLERGRSWTFFNAIFHQESTETICAAIRNTQEQYICAYIKNQIRPKIIRPDPVVSIIHPRLEKTIFIYIYIDVYI
jgi:hypothetical protein